MIEIESRNKLNIYPTTVFLIPTSGHEVGYEVPTKYIMTIINEKYPLLLYFKEQINVFFAVFVRFMTFVTMMMG
jgi:hypothetical protein